MIAAPTVAPVVISKLTGVFAPGTSNSTASTSSAESNTKKRSLNQSDFVNDEDDDSESSASELLTKRLRPNFLNDVEQSMLLAQLETTSTAPSSQASLKVQTTTAPSANDADSIVSSSGASVSEKENGGRSSATKAKLPRASTPSSSSSVKSPAPKKPASTIQTTLFSPDASKQPAARKATPDSQKKRGCPPKAVAVDGATATAGPVKETVKTLKAPKAPKASTAAKRPGAVCVCGLVYITTGCISYLTCCTVRLACTVSAQWEEVAVQGTVPVERWGDSVTKISDDRVVVYGGADDDEATLGGLHVFDLKKCEWSTPLNCESIPRAWHDAVYLETKRLLLVFGGERFMGGDQMDVLSDIMVLDTECFLWYPPAVSGVTPMARSGHTCTVVGEEIVVFGGSRGRNRQSTVHVLDSDTWHWKNVKLEGKPPSARTYHSAVAVGDRVIIFGGNDAKKSFNSVHVLQKKKAEDTWTWFHPCVVGVPPQARTGHSATLVDGNKVLIFGGWDPQQEGVQAAKVFNDSFLLNTETWEWEAVVVQQQQPNKTLKGEEGPGQVDGDDGSALALPGRVGHRAVVDAKSNKVYIFGGQNGVEKRMNAVHSVTFCPQAQDGGEDGQSQQQPESEAEVANGKDEMST